MMGMLDKIETGVRKTPYFVGAYGPAGVGKTTLFSNAPKPLFLATERGTDQLDVARLDCETWFDFIKAMQELHLTAHPYKTVIVDSIDHLEPKIWEMVAKDHGKKSIEEIGYAKGYIFALEYWRQVLNEVKNIRAKGINVAFIAHAIKKKFHDPVLGEDYDRYQLKLHQKASDLITESMDALLFCNNETLAVNKDGQKKKFVGDGTRMMFAEHRPAFDAKNRYGLPAELPLSYSEFDKYASRTDAEKSAELHKQIYDLMENIQDETFYNTVEKTVDEFKTNVPKLEEILTKLKARFENE